MTSDRDPARGTGGIDDSGLAGSGEPPLEGAASPAEEPLPHEAGVASDTSSTPAEPLDREYSEPGQAQSQTAPNMLPGRERRRSAFERLFVRLIATAGVVGIGVVIGAIMADNNVQGWIIGLVISAVTVVLSAILWSSRQL
jgi:hypothetical protein